MALIVRKSSTLPSTGLHRYAKRRGQEATQAECSAHMPPNNKLTAVIRETAQPENNNE
jgi:hypothetical protein